MCDPSKRGKCYTYKNIDETKLDILKLFKILIYKGFRYDDTYVKIY